MVEHVHRMFLSAVMVHAPKHTYISLCLSFSLAGGTGLGNSLCSSLDSNVSPCLSLCAATKSSSKFKRNNVMM
jgi:hypothetical protein